MDRSNGLQQRTPLSQQTALRFGGFELHPGRQLLSNGVSLPLGRIALQLLAALVRARGALVTKDELFDAGWPRVVVVENALHQHMRALRQALGADAGLIVTVARRGYRFTGLVEELVVAHAQTGSATEFAVPSPLTPLIGREQDVVTIEPLLDTRRCVTLLGPGGVGKTRLALEIARRWVEGGGAPCHWVELAALVDGRGVGAAIASAFGLTGPSGQAPLARVRQALRDASALLVLDNCEHLIEACAAAARELLHANPGLKLLATSQRPLGISGEQRVRLALLKLPPAGTLDHERIAAAPAVQLLLARLADCNALLHLDAAALADAATLCHQLDGNALAIELAAPRVAALGLAATRAALSDHFQLLSGGARDGLPKHQSLNATIDWSHALLSAEQATVLRRLAVFAGGWTLASATAVITAVNDERIDIASRMAELVEQSLILAEGSALAPRFRMLEAQRLHALQRLRASDEVERCEVAHARHFAALFEASHGEWDRMPDAQWIATYGPEQGNLRAAIRWATARADAPLLARLLGSSVWLWRSVGAMHEFRQLLRQPLLGHHVAQADACQARLKLALAYTLHATSSESASVQAAAACAVDAFEAVADDLGKANALLCLASAYAQLGDTVSHQACLRRVDGVLAEHREGKAYGWYCGSHAWAAQLAGDVPAALAWATRSCAAYRGSGAWHGQTRAMLHLADLHLALGDAEQALTLGQECVARLRGGLHRDDLGRALANLGTAWFCSGKHEEARGCWAQALHELRGLDFSYWIFDHIALLATAEGRDEAAAQMLGYADASYARLGKGRRVQNEQTSHDRALALLRSRCTANELTALLAAGAVASEASVAALALAPAMR